MIASSLAPQCKNRTYFGLEAERPEEFTEPFLRDIVYCPECGGALKAEYLRYNHIGRMYCLGCGRKSPDRDFVVTDIDRDNSRFTAEFKGERHTFTLINDNIVNVYNSCAVIAMLTTIGLTPEQIEKGFSQSKIVKSRFDTMTAGKLNITFQMSKGQNPIACTGCFRYVASIPVENKCLIVSTDDIGDNTNESENVCWLYDCDYALFKDKSITKLIFTGPRCRDHLLRALIAGVDRDKIILCEDTDKAVSLIDPEEHQDIYVLYDLYRQEDAAKMRVQFKSLGEGTK